MSIYEKLARTDKKELSRKLWRALWISNTAAAAFVSIIFLNSAENKDVIEKIYTPKSWTEYNQEIPKCTSFISDASKLTDLFLGLQFGVLSLGSALAANGFRREKENQH